MLRHICIKFLITKGIIICQRQTVSLAREVQKGHQHSIYRFTASKAVKMQALEDR